MTHVEVTGRPVARFRFKSLQSWNEVFGGGHWRRGQGATKRWRTLGEKMGLRWRAAKGMESLRVDKRDAKGKLTGHTHWPIAIQTRILIAVKVIRGTERKYDIHNVFVKALFDGFSDAGLWFDDEWAYVPMVLFTWAEDTQGRGKHFLIEIHELTRFTENGMAQSLPTGEARHGERGGVGVAGAGGPPANGAHTRHSVRDSGLQARGRDVGDGLPYLLRRGSVRNRVG